MPGGPLQRGSRNPSTASMNAAGCSTFDRCTTGNSSDCAPGTVAAMAAPWSARPRPARPAAEAGRPAAWRRSRPGRRHG
ncbi:hypothetical protein G6F24_016488 [Rhizopus arrhizus]|nr:hypothetical protein G6F24_016488 [Rhizopus arrhizus]